MSVVSLVKKGLYELLGGKVSHHTRLRPRTLRWRYLMQCYMEIQEWFMALHLELQSKEHFNLLSPYSEGAEEKQLFRVHPRARSSAWSHTNRTGGWLSKRVRWRTCSIVLYPLQHVLTWLAKLGIANWMPSASSRLRGHTWSLWRTILEWNGRSWYVFHSHHCPGEPRGLNGLYQLQSGFPKVLSSCTWASIAQHQVGGRRQRSHRWTSDVWIQCPKWACGSEMGLSTVRWSVVWFRTTSACCGSS